MYIQWENLSITNFLALYSRRVLLSSAVWGNDPMVVVGRIGRLSFFCCASNLELTSVERRWSDPLRAEAWKLTTQEITSQYGLNIKKNRKKKRMKCLQLVELHHC